MGVPFFYRWLTKKYTNLIVPCIDDFNSPNFSNPNQIEFDNLYLDMNGIIHQCTHPDDREPPETDDEKMIEMFKEIDRIFRCVRPRKLIYFAIDGVAPRAKMNQQRARRFMASYETQEMRRIEQEYIEELNEEEKKKLCLKERWDSNVISPGTVFMEKVARALRFFIHERLNQENSAWKKIKIILSDASVPGEGEHKFIDFIRSQRCREGYDPNTKHVAVGMDADLILLGLGTHEPHFSILRHTRQKGKYEFLRLSALRQHLEKEFYTLSLPFAYNFERIIDDLVCICSLVGNDFIPGLPSLVIQEGAMDLVLEVYKKTLPKLKGYITDAGKIDFSRFEVFISGVGSLEHNILVNKFSRKQQIEARKKEREKALSEKKDEEKKELPKVNNEESPKVDENKETPKVEENKESPKEEPPKEEQKIEQTLQQNEATKQDEIPENKDEEKYEIFVGNLPPNVNENTLINLFSACGKIVKVAIPTSYFGRSRGFAFIGFETQKQMEKALQLDQREFMGKVLRVNRAFNKPEKPQTKSTATNEFERELMLRIKKSGFIDPKMHPDLVQLGSHGYRERYYNIKFKIPPEKMDTEVKKVCEAYLQGIAWVCLYYYGECPSWNWFYPYHYAPLAQDLSTIKSFDVKFEKGKPFSALNQLLAILPPHSAHALPEPYRKLMQKDSPIADFYPEKIEIDGEGVRELWQATVIVPFIDEQRLLQAVAPLEKQLSPEDAKRNIVGNDLLFVHFQNKLRDLILELYQKSKSKVQLTTKQHGISGFISPSKFQCPLGDTYKSPFPKLLSDISNNQGLVAEFEIPSDSPQISRLLPGIKFIDWEILSWEEPAELQLSRARSEIAQLRQVVDMLRRELSDTNMELQKERKRIDKLENLISQMMNK